MPPYLNPCPLGMCFSYCSALASERLFEQTATAGDFCLCTDFEQLPAVPASPAPTLWWEARQAGRNKAAAVLGCRGLQWERTEHGRASREPAAELYRPNVELPDCHPWKMGFLQHKRETWAGLGKADDMGSSSVHRGSSSSLCGSGPGERHRGGCALITQMCSWHL